MNSSIQLDQLLCKQSCGLLEKELQLLKNYQKKDLSLYEKNTMNKVNFISYLGMNYICSCFDKYKKIRIPIVSVFLKILSNRTEQNIARMSKIKRLIYSCKFNEIVQGKVIPVNQLLTNFAITINSFQYGLQNNENTFIKKLNAQPFFDHIIMEAFYETFYDKNQENLLTSNISKWIKNSLNITIIFSKKDIQSQSDATIVLRKNDKHQVLRRFNSFNVCSMISIEQQINHNTPAKAIRKMNKPPQLQTDQVLNSISSIDSPIRRMSQRNKLHQVYLSISVQNSLQFQPMSNRLIIDKQNEQPNINRPKPYKHANQKGFWKICCCGKD